MREHRPQGRRPPTDEETGYGVPVEEEEKNRSAADAICSFTLRNSDSIPFAFLRTSTSTSIAQTADINHRA